jgi:hypothetical protein
LRGRDTPVRFVGSGILFAFSSGRNFLRARSAPGAICSGRDLLRARSAPGAICSGRDLLRARSAPGAIFSGRDLLRARFAPGAICSGRAGTRPHADGRPSLRERRHRRQVFLPGPGSPTLASPPRTAWAGRLEGRPVRRRRPANRPAGRRAAPAQTRNLPRQPRCRWFSPGSRRRPRLAGKNPSASGRTPVNLARSREPAPAAEPGYRSGKKCLTGRRAAF